MVDAPAKFALLWEVRRRHMIDNMDGGRPQSRRPANDRHDDGLLSRINQLLLEAAFLDRELLVEPPRHQIQREVAYAS